MKNKMIKTKKEIELLKKSATITNSCIPLIEKSLKERITEKELARRINKNIRNHGASLSFQTLVASGKRSFQIHPRPYSAKKIISGMGYADFGACYKGYRTDITVPFVKGKITKRERKIVEVTLHAYKLAVRSVKIGLPCWKLQEKVNRFLKSKGYECPHAIGHGLGKNIHELPHIGMPRKKRLNKKKKRRWDKLKKIKFQENMVFTIEPAVYVKGFGGCRIENDFLISKKGIKILTNSRLIEI